LRIYYLTIFLKELFIEAMCILSDCQNKDKYGEFCYKHRRLTLVENNNISFSRFTNKEKDYLKGDINNTIKTLQNTGTYKIPIPLPKKKQELFVLLSQIIQGFQIYDEKDLLKIKNIQTKFRDNQKTIVDNLRGDGFVNKTLSNNDTDFFTYETRDEIADKYYLYGFLTYGLLRN